MSQVRQFYAGQKIFITGGTGFLGKILIEKLLRSCPDIGTIYLLVRAKKGKSAQERIHALFANSIFDVLRSDYPEFLKKIVGVPGDITEEGLGLSTADHACLVNEVSVIFHLAASVRFNDKLEYAVAINVNSVKSVVDLAKACKNLKVGIHVSTAYSHCVRKSINEELYPPPLSYEGVNKLVKNAAKNNWSEEERENFTKGVLGEWPNTYTYTKAIAESVVTEFAKDLPFAIFRPATVNPTHDEPVPGWLCNLTAAAGGIFGVSLGIMHAILVDPNVKADVVPVDLVCNALITSAWETGITERSDQDIPVYNYVPARENPITWGQILDKTNIYATIFPMNAAVYYASHITTKSRRLYTMLSFLLQLMPALIIDNVARLFGKELGTYKIARKMTDGILAVEYFITTQWDFENQRVQNLWKRISPEERRTFPFDMRNVDWDEHMMRMVRGIRKYIAGEPDGNREKAKRRYFYLYIVHATLRLTFWISILWMTCKVFRGCSLLMP